MTFPFHTPVISDIVRDGKVDRREVEQIVDERIKQLVQTDGIQNYRITNLGTNRFDASESSASYPWGISWLSLSGAAEADGWPHGGGAATGMVETKVFSRGAGQRIRQWFYPKDLNETAPYDWTRSRNNDDTAWEPWTLVRPITYTTNSGTAVNVAVASTWETLTAIDQTISNLPDTANCDYAIDWRAQFTCTALGVTNQGDCAIRLRISFDGGSTWFTSSLLGRADPPVGDHADMTAFYRIDNQTSITGDIVVEPQFWGTQTTTDFDNFFLIHEFHGLT